MSAWRRVALEKLPEYRRIIDEARSPMALWLELCLQFEDLYRTETLNDRLIRSFFDYARWCVEQPKEGEFLSDAGTAACCAFFEHLPKHDAIRRDLRRWLTREEFLGLRVTFGYHLSKEEFVSFESEFLSKSAKKR